MRTTAIASFIAVVHIGSASIAAQQPADGLPPKPNPFGNLFGTSTTTASPPRFSFRTAPLEQHPEPHLAPKTRVVCGLTVIPADPKIDPAIRHDVPEDGPSFPIRSVEPSVCRR